MKIESAQYEMAYRLGKEVFAGRMQITAAQNHLAALGVNRSSAADLVYGLCHMLDGKRFTRSLSVAIVDYYLSSILRDYGMERLGNAVNALRGYIQYYRGHTGAKMTGHDEVLAKHAALLEGVRKSAASVPEERTLNTYLFVTASEEHPENVTTNPGLHWSCAGKSADGDRALVYVKREGIAYEWCITSDSEHNPGGDWPYRCRVEYLRAFEPPITLRELCAVAPERDWNAPHRNMRVKAATIIPGFIAEAVRSLRPPSLTELDRGFFKDVEASMRAPTEKRRARLAAAARYPRKRRVTVEIYCRNPDVVAEVLMRANGLCERCERPAPFLRLSDGSPYLESHHTIRLADEGPDTVENTVALCPNCHRETHYGRPRLRS